jgi:hypothetical protein
MIEGQAAPRRLKSSTAVLQICSMLQICSVSQSISQSVSQSVSRESLLLECEPSFFFFLAFTFNTSPLPVHPPLPSSISPALLPLHGLLRAGKRLITHPHIDGHFGGALR